MKAKAQAKFMLNEQDIELLETTERNYYHDIKRKLQMAAANVVREVVNALKNDGIAVQKISIKVSEASTPTIDDIKTEFTVLVTVEGEPYERPDSEPI